MKKADHIFNKSGNSNAKLALDVVGDDLGVNKYISKYTERDLQSVQKQKNFQNTQEILAVPIKQVVCDKKTLRLSMPYVTGIVGSDYAILSDKTVKDSLIRIINGYLTNLEKNSEKQLLLKSTILSKLSELQINIKSNGALTKQSKVLSLNLITDLRKQLKDNQIYYPASICHGDLTLSNMIFDQTRQKLYLIDFLEVFLNSFIIDYVKLKQDLVYGWSSRFEGEQERARHAILGRHVIQGLHKPAPQYSLITNILNKLNILRIGPYVRDSYTATWYEKTLREI